MEEYRLNVSENMALKRILGSEMEEMPRGRRNLHSEGPGQMYSSPSVIRIIKSWRMRWTELVA
jgi:hypothetical protein